VLLEGDFSCWPDPARRCTKALGHMSGRRSGREAEERRARRGHEEDVRPLPDQRALALPLFPCTPNSILEPAPSAHKNGP